MHEPRVSSLFLSQPNQTSHGPLNLLPDTRQQEPLEIPARLPLDPLRQVPVLLRVRPTHVIHRVPVPVVSHDPRREQLVARARTRHGGLQEVRRVHILVHRVAELVKEGIFHVAGEFLQLY